jgi:hypothetical protein
MRRAVIPLVFIAAVLLMFFFRAPVIVLTDASFDGIYGARRALAARAGLSFRFFRRVKPVRIDENAGVDMAAEALEAASPRPYCALVPYRYVEGGRRYAAKFPGVPVGVLGTPDSGRESPGEPGENGNLHFFRTDGESDFYRAGRCAALLTGGRGNILVFRPDFLPEKFRAALLEGLGEGVPTNPPASGDSPRVEPRFAGSETEIGNYGDFSCVIFAGSFRSLPEHSFQIPVIVFSWLDPVFTPRETKVLFDDSPWAVAGEAVPLAVRGRGGDIPSRMIVLKDRTEDEALLGLLNEISHFRQK